MTTQILRSGFSLHGIRIFLEFDADKASYRLATRWRWLTAFDNVNDACDAFEALELVDVEEVAAAKAIKREIKRVPRHRCAGGGRGMDRIWNLVDCVEKRAAGLRPVRCGSKGAVDKWVPFGLDGGVSAT